METITFETKCYENDWRFLLQTPYLDEMVARCETPFTHRQLIINNVNDLSTVCRHADEKVRQGVIDAYYVAADYADEALRFFGIDRDSFGRGYYYSIAELVGLYLCRTAYHLHFSSDARMDKGGSWQWIERAVTLMEANPSYAVANPTWNRRYKEAARESIGEIEDFYVGYGFSDQCYLVRSAQFRQPIYNEQNPASARYPAYGGELFEKRVDSYMRNHGLKRLTHKKASYMHRNFPKNPLLKRLRQAECNWLR